MQKRRVTLAEVAKAADVSLSMASYVLRCGDRSKSSPQTRARIREAAARLGYQVDVIAQALRYGQSKTVGVVLPPLDLGGYLSELMCAMERSFRECGYSLYYTFFETEDEKSFGEAMKRAYGMKVAAIITPTYKNIPRNNIPVIIWGNDRPEYDCVFPDKKALGREVIDLLIGKGHRRIAFLGYSGDVRYEAMRSALQDHGLAMPEDFWIPQTMDSYSQNISNKQLHGILTSASRPTAIVCHSDELAIFAMHEAQKLGLSVPDDLSVVGFDNLPVGLYTLPALTTYDQNFAEMARYLVQTVMNRMNNPDAPPERHGVVPILIERGSLGIANTPQK